MKVRVAFTIDVNLPNYNREYNGKPEGESAAEVRDDIKGMAFDAVDYATKHLQPDVVRSITVTI
jgi:hypothetical protein